MGKLGTDRPAIDETNRVVLKKVRMEKADKANISKSNYVETHCFSKGSDVKHCNNSDYNDPLARQYNAYRVVKSYSKGCDDYGKTHSSPECLPTVTSQVGKGDGWPTGVVHGWWSSTDASMGAVVSFNTTDWGAKYITSLKSCRNGDQCDLTNGRKTADRGAGAVTNADWNGLMKRYCFKITPSDAENGNCPPGNTVCPNMLKTGGNVANVNGGYSVCIDYINNAGNANEVEDAMTSICSNPLYIGMPFCDCISAPNAGGRLNDVYKDINKLGDAYGQPQNQCWFKPCQKNGTNERNILIPPSKFGLNALNCQAPACVNFNINQNNTNASENDFTQVMDCEMQNTTYNGSQPGSTTSSSTSDTNTTVPGEVPTYDEVASGAKPPNPGTDTDGQASPDPAAESPGMSTGAKVAVGVAVSIASLIVLYIVVKIVKRATS